MLCYNERYVTMIPMMPVMVILFLFLFLLYDVDL